MSEEVGKPEQDVTSERDLYVEFDGRQLIVRSDVPGIRDYVARQFGNMLVSALTLEAGTLDVFRNGDGFAIRSAESMEFPYSTLEQILPLVKDEVHLQFMRARPDLLWLHAGAVESGGTALLLSGTSGQGKSTLATLLCEREWSYLSDDIAPVRMNADEVLPFPQAPTRRIHPGREVTAEEMGAIARELVQLPPERIRRVPAPIRGIVFIRYSKGAPARLTALSRGAAALEILRNSTNLVDHKGAAVSRAAAMARHLQAFALTYGFGGDAAKLVDSLK